MAAALQYIRPFLGGELGDNVTKTDGGRPRFARGRATTTLIEGTLGDF
jgi:hypothetical protein